MVNFNSFTKEVQLGYMIYIMILVTKILPSVNKIQQSLYHLSFISATSNLIYSTIENFKKTISTPNKNSENKLIFNNIKIQNGETFFLSVEDFEVSLGKTIRIKGKSGSGKSSILNLILGLNKPVTGNISLIGYDVHYPNNELLEKIGYVAQETRLFNGTLAENIAFGLKKEFIDIKKVHQIIEKVGLQYLVKREKEGIWQEITSENYQLSGGEKQKIGIARALYNDPKILLLDEITTSLDYISKNDIYNLIKSVCFDKDKIVLFISHEDDVPLSFNYEISINNNKAKFVKLDM
jgi:ABC-type bacteriocin/lantibiotic exporter with double-glycine peptidase domain